VVLAVALRGRGSGGRLGGWFLDTIRPADAVLALATAAAALVAAGLVAGPAIAAATAAGGLLGLAGALAVIRARGGVDGDGLGTSVELVQAAALVAAAVAGAG
jgi:cobalamin synthase